MPRPSLSVALVAFALVAGGGCTRRNGEFCCTQVDACMRHGGDSTLQPCDQESDKPYCDNDSRTCIAPPGTPCGPGGECASADTPICFEGLCVECGGAADCPFSNPVCGAAHQCQSCADESECSGFADRPFCDQGACVGCRDGDDCQQETAPICEEADGMCRGCRSAAECASEVCDWVGGGCVDESDVLYVEMDGDGSSCTREDPCGSIAQARGEAGGQRIWIHMAPGDYQETVALDGETIRIIGEQANLRSNPGDSPVFDVRGGADLRVSGLRIHDAEGNGDGPGDGVYCTNTGGSSTVVLDRVVLEDNDDQGVDGNNCMITVTRSMLIDNRLGGIALDSANFEVVNNFIVGNGSTTIMSAGVLIDRNPPTSGRLEHNTIVANTNPEGEPSGIQCVLVGSPPLVFRNNIVYGNQGSASQVDGDNCDHIYSLIGPNGIAGEGNISTPAPSFVSETDFHLDGASSGIDVAGTSDVAIDFDGEPRPGGDGNDMGADEVR